MMAVRNNRSRKVRNAPIADLDKMAQRLLTPEQAKHGIALVDRVDHSDADHREMKRSGQTKTIRKLTLVEKLVKAGIITKDQGLACEYYAEQHEFGFVAMQGVTANYCGAGGGGGSGWDHAARSAAQEAARDAWHDARFAISSDMLMVLDGVLLCGCVPSTKGDKLTFSWAAWSLWENVRNRLSLAA